MRFIGSVALLAVSLGVALVAAEWIVRIAFSDLTSFSPMDSWFGRRWREANFARNAWGFREREFASPKPDGTVRIVVVGDSFTVAMGLSLSERYVAIAEDRLTGSAGERFEVVSFPSLGHEIHHHLRKLDAHALRAEPDFVLLQWAANDWEISKQERPPVPGPLLPPRQHRSLLRSSALYSVIDHQWRHRQASLGLTESYADYMRRRFGDADAKDSLTAMETLAAFVQRTRDEGVAMGMLLFPVLGYSLGDDYPFAFLHERVMERCRIERLAICIDLRDVYRPHLDRLDELRMNRFDFHAGPLGHRLAGEAFADAFSEWWGSGGAAGAHSASARPVVESGSASSQR